METERPTVTTTITDEDRAAADALLPTLEQELGPVAVSERIAWAIAQARAEAYRQGYNAACRDRMSRDSGDPSSVSREDTERALTVFGRTHGGDVPDIARTIARWRDVDEATGREAGLAELERASDLAHAAGYAEGLERVADELGWPDPRGLWRAAEVVRTMQGPKP